MVFGTGLIMLFSKSVAIAYSTGGHDWRLEAGGWLSAEAKA